MYFSFSISFSACILKTEILKIGEQAYHKLLFIFTGGFLSPVRFLGGVFSLNF